MIPKKKFIKSTVADAIKTLLQEAKKSFQTAPLRSKRYVEMLFNLVKKYKIRLKKEQKESFCRKCHMVWVPEKNIKINFDKKHNAFYVTCGNCSYRRRLGDKKGNS